MSEGFCSGSFCPVAFCRGAFDQEPMSGTRIALLTEMLRVRYESVVAFGYRCQTQGPCCWMYLVDILSSQAAKTAPIRRMAVRETSVSRHHEAPIEGFPENKLYYHSRIVLTGLRDEPN